MKTELTKEQINEVKELTNDVRKELGVYSDVPVADDLRSFLEKRGIIVCEQVFSENIDAAITIFEASDDKMTFIGLNSALHYDEQLFALAHELYHYLTKTGAAYEDKEDAVTERKADRFAAELLLPSDVLSQNIDGVDLNKESINRVWRIIARIQNKWWLPYRAIVNRLNEEGYISEFRYDELYHSEHRDPTTGYGRILCSVNKKKFQLLNSVLATNSISDNVVELTIQNFEDEIISEEEFIDSLALFGKEPADFGFEIRAVNDDEEMADLFMDGESDES